MNDDKSSLVKTVAELESKLALRTKPEIREVVKEVIVEKPVEVIKEVIKYIEKPPVPEPKVYKK